jgi:hypothetical protein
MSVMHHRVTLVLKYDSWPCAIPEPGPC